MATSIVLSLSKDILDSLGLAEGSEVSVELELDVDYDNSSRSALASCKSGVSNPSVNQP
jgi:hypothetical protein